MVLGRHRELGTAHGAPAQAQAVEGLRAGDLVDEVEVDVQQIGFAGRGMHQVAFQIFSGSVYAVMADVPSLRAVSREASQIS